MIVSVLTRLGYQTKYAYLKIDCYGNPQDHICAAVWDNDRWKLIDPTLPYRKWKGYDCPHKEYELMTPEEFESKMKEEENYWTQRSITWNNQRYAGLLYAPWIHEEVVVNTVEILETVFLLLIINSAKEYSIYVYYMTYLEENSSTPIMCRVKDNKGFFRFSIKDAQNIWDEEQWGNEYLENEIPIQFQNLHIQKMIECMDKTLPVIQKIVSSIVS